MTAVSPTSYTNLPLVADGETLWVRVEYDGTTVSVRCSKSDTEPEDWSQETEYYTSTNFTDVNGGHQGFCYGKTYVDNVTIKNDGNDDGEFDHAEDKVQHVELFELDANDYGENCHLAHGAAGNLTYDGRRKFVYDAWGRLAEVKRAYRNSEGTLTEGSTVATITYDGLGRRIIKAVSNSGDWDATYEYYYDGQRMIETRDGSDDVLKQHVWGTQYVDELVQIGLNDDPTDAGEDDCETYLYALQDANYNVLAIVESDGDVKERYEYTPYGRRTVYKSAGSYDLITSAPILESQRVQISSEDQAYSICDVGHQGLFHDKETGLIHNRARMLHPTLGRFLQRDPLGYVDGMSLYDYVRSGPIAGLDPSGLRIRLKLNVWAGPKFMYNTKEWIAFTKKHGAYHVGIFGIAQAEGITTSKIKLSVKGKRNAKDKCACDFEVGPLKVDITVHLPKRGARILTPLGHPSRELADPDQPEIVNAKWQNVMFHHEMGHADVIGGLAKAFAQSQRAGAVCVYRRRFPIGFIDIPMNRTAQSDASCKRKARLLRARLLIRLAEPLKDLNAQWDEDKQGGQASIDLFAIWNARRRYHRKAATWPFKVWDCFDTTAGIPAAAMLWFQEWYYGIKE